MLSRRRALLSLTAVALLTTAGCGGSEDKNDGPAASKKTDGALPAVTASPAPSASVSTATDPTAEDPNAPAACRSSAVTVKLVKGSAAAGQAYTAVVVTNTGGAACSLRGYNTLRFLDSGGGRAVGTTIGKLVTPPVTTVTLAPGKSASATIGTVTGKASASSPTGSVPCPTTPATLAVTLPRDTATVRVRWTGGPVCRDGRIVTGAYLLGIQAA